MKRFIKQVMTVVIAVFLTACMSTSENNVDFSYLISASEDINPDIENRPSPVVVRVFQLTNRVNFDNATYDAIFDVGHNALGAEYISLNEYLIHPGSSNEVELQISENAKFIGVAAGYRSIDLVNWRTLAAVPEGKFWRDAGIEIKVEKLSVRIIEK